MGLVSHVDSFVLLDMRSSQVWSDKLTDKGSPVW